MYILARNFCDMTNLWTSAEHALGYLTKVDKIPHRTEGEAVLLEEVPKTVKPILDLGTGDEPLLELLKIEPPSVKCVALDFSPLVSRMWTVIGSGWN